MLLWAMMFAAAAGIAGLLGFGGAASAGRCGRPGPVFRLSCRISGGAGCRDPSTRLNSDPEPALKNAPATGGGRLRATSSSAPGEGRDDSWRALERQINANSGREFP